MSENMVSLNLGGRPRVTLPASAFPVRADAYVCDRCKRDITKYFRPPTSHSWGPMGPERYQCLCGQQYLTGAREWDHLGVWERRRRVEHTLVFGVISSVMASILSVLAYIFLRFALGYREGALATSLVTVALPFVLIQISFWSTVIASVWRSRIG
jgi:hypothetical protein